MNASATLGRSCTVTVTSRVAGSLTVLPGQTLRVSSGASVGGAVIVKPGGTLILEGASIAGAIPSDGAQSVVVCGSTVGGSVSVKNTIGPFQFGDNADGCAPNRVSGVVSLKDNPPPR